MTVHMFRGVFGPNPDKMTLAQAKEAWQTWISNHSEWKADSTPHSFVESNTQPDGSGAVYWQGTCRFLLDDAKANLFQKLEDKYVNKVDWYRIGYHECSHDESSPSPCTWGDEREWTAKDQAIPPEVPDFL